MPAWIEARAEHLLAKNPSMPKSMAFALATQQSHAIGKSPKGYGTVEGRAVAKAKYDTPKDDKKTANPGNLKSAKMEKMSYISQVHIDAFVDELEKIKEAGFLGNLLGGDSFSNFTGGGQAGAPAAAAKPKPAPPKGPLNPGGANALYSAQGPTGPTMSNRAIRATAGSMGAFKPAPVGLR